MKMAKASEADLNMAMDLAGMLDNLGHRHCPAMPAVIARNDGDEDFDRDDDEQCGRALRALLETADRGSLFRVVYGAAVMLDPRNKLVDPGADSIEHHPDRQDSARLRWLLEDHADPAKRERCRELLGRMAGMSYSAAAADIDAAMRETAATEAA
ncbi:hypothetical protein [Ideonella livida]|uniref:Uncharacterized protein n=1 Tax=Ideonella livida TaxID=2707176 RepID=A0A7C9PJC7_9BURK|nr:hypothetical protein [Ideonella livida]NDY93436.1 hypothetical protein [Ideonella livida]